MGTPSCNDATIAEKNILQWWHNWRRRRAAANFCQPLRNRHINSGIPYRVESAF
jgi:hypothetical protein